ncbi:hypothetical protein REPUB_Repub13aG0237200 [Reevesia pubescens]
MAMKKLLTMIIELDMSKKQVDMQGQTTRADGVRTPLVEIILDELTYDGDMLSPFLQVFDDPKWKLEIIVQYFLKYTAKPSVHTRRSNGPSEDSTFLGVLKFFSNSSSTRNVTKKIDVEVLQLLLAHAFQAYLSMSPQQHQPGMSDCEEAVIDSFLMEISKNVIAAFNSLRASLSLFNFLRNISLYFLVFLLRLSVEISTLGKEALFTAAMIISTS